MSQFVTYAQNNEDVILDAYFKDVTKGSYVDVGANHPVNDSVTKHFYKKGWRGINVEPIKNLHELLEQDRPEDINLRVGVSDKAGTLTLREYANDGLSTFSGDLQRAYNDSPQEKTAVYKDVKVPVITLKELFEKHPLEHINFMKVDVEGFEYEVLRGNNWKKYRPEMLCIEANHDIPDKDWRKLLQSHDYEKVWNDGLNDYYLAKESIARKSNFSYAEAMLLGDQILPHHVIDRIGELQATAHDAEIKAEVQEIRLKQVEKEKSDAEAKVLEQQRFKNALKLLVKSVDNVIVARIERLHSNKTSSGIKLNTNVTAEYDGSSKSNLLASIREQDLRTYYTFRKSPRRRKFYAYRATMGTYTFARRALHKGLKTTAGVVKKDGSNDK